MVLLEDGIRQSHGEPTCKTGVPMVRINLNDKNHGKGYSGPPVLDGIHLLLMRWKDSDFQTSSWLRIGALHY